MKPLYCSMGLAAFLCTISTNSLALDFQARMQAQFKASGEAQKFLGELKATNSLPGEASFLAERSTTIGGRFCQKYIQTVEKAPVLGARASLCFAPDGTTEDKDSLLCDDECVKSRQDAVYSDEELRDIGERELRLALDKDYSAKGYDRNPFGTVKKADLKKVWFKDQEGNKLHAAAVIEFRSENPDNRFVAYVDGTNGKLMAYEHLKWRATEVGKARVFQKDPVTTPALKDVDLTDLLMMGHLENNYFNILNDDGEEASSSTGDYIFDLKDTHFDEAQAYFGLSYLYDKLFALGFQPFGKLPVYVHFEDHYANAFYDGEKIALGDGDGTELLDLAKDNTVLTHEYWHAVIDHTAKPLMVAWFGDGLAIHEGHADFGACIVYDSPILGIGVMVDQSPMRRCDTDLDFYKRKGEPHQGGQVWSGAMWEVRRKLGKKDTDAMAMDLLMRVKPTGYLGTTKMEDMYAALLASDQALHKGVNKKTIKAIFTSRGFPERRGDSGSTWAAFDRPKL